LETGAPGISRTLDNRDIQVRKCLMHLPPMSGKSETGDGSTSADSYLALFSRLHVL